MFATPTGQPHRNSNFGRRALRPAVDGTLHRPQAVVRLEPVKPGLTFHGLRHGHKTWMIADGVPEVAQARRLGHILGDRIRETYSHVAAEVDARLLDGLQDRWDKAVADSPHHPAGGNRDPPVPPTTDAGCAPPAPTSIEGDRHEHP